MMFLLTIKNNNELYYKSLVFAKGATEALAYAESERDSVQSISPAFETTFSLNVVDHGSEIMAHDPAITDVNYIKALF